MADTAKRPPRRQFTDEFKASAVRLVACAHVSGDAAG
jgi:transposase-like protein